MFRACLERCLESESWPNEIIDKDVAGAVERDGIFGLQRPKLGASLSKRFCVSHNVAN